MDEKKIHQQPPVLPVKPIKFIHFNAEALKKTKPPVPERPTKEAKFSLLRLQPIRPGTLSASQREALRATYFFRKPLEAREVVEITIEKPQSRLLS